MWYDIESVGILPKFEKIAYFHHQVNTSQAEIRREGSKYAHEITNRLDGVSSNWDHSKSTEYPDEGNQSTST